MFVWEFFVWLVVGALVLVVGDFFNTYSIYFHIYIFNMIQVQFSHVF